MMREKDLLKVGVSVLIMSICLGDVEAVTFS
jgi:hypothetical protein